jgi:hypothetical protein
MENVIQMKDLLNQETNEEYLEEEIFFTKKDISSNEIDKEEQEYQELCLTSLTVCCTCD